jgi:hypothetical protein
MEPTFVEVGACGLSCRLCPAHHRETASKCEGCKSPGRMGAACSILNCAFKKHQVEFCGFCPENASCQKWGKNREAAKIADSFVSYQALERNISIIQAEGLAEFENQQKKREHLLEVMLREFNDGRSKSFYCIAATVFKPEELEAVLLQAKAVAAILDVKQKSALMHSLLNETAVKSGYLLKLRKPK